MSEHVYKYFSADQYKKALIAIQSEMSDVHYRMLQAQYEASEHTVTAGKLALAVGYDSFPPVNLHYGRLGKLISETLGQMPNQRRDGTYRWWSVLSTGKDSPDGFLWIMQQELVVALEALEWVQSTTANNIYPDEVDEAETALTEGALHKIQVNAYERNPKARRKCIEYYGATCIVCGFNFGVVYGVVGQGLIHVHHERPLSEIDGEYIIDPVLDLKPVCPNCHAIIHRQKSPYSIEEVKTMLEKNRQDEKTSKGSGLTTA